MKDEVIEEIKQLMNRMVRDRERAGEIDFEASEKAVRGVGQAVGGKILEGVLNSWDDGYVGEYVECGKGHIADFVENREKKLTTVLGAIKVVRAYYRCRECGKGLIPRDTALDIVRTGFSPGLRRMMGRVGAQESFEAGSRDLAELAGVAVETKAVERVAETIGEQVEEWAGVRRELAIDGKLSPLKAAGTYYVSMDGTGAPVIKKETEGRKGKDETGIAKTREVKLGCIFTQTKIDEKGRPVRDESSTTYVGAIEEAQLFGRRLYGEAERRGVSKAQRVVVLGDGAPWIWELANEHFHGATQILDLYHAREHLYELSKALYGGGSVKAKQWSAVWREQLDEGAVEKIVASMRRLRPKTPEAQKNLRRAIAYFEKNKERMRYPKFRANGLFVGSGVMEAGCKTLVGYRLKQSGMRWSVKGANAIIALRCCQLSGHWEHFWQSRSVA